jgi:hypothetical protein
VDTAHLLVTGTLSRRSLYVGLTRGRESNTAHIVTGTTAPPGHPPYEQASPESVVKAILDRDDADLSATEQIRQAQDQAGGTGHLLTLWSAAVRPSLCPQIDQQIKARLTGSEACRYQREHARPVLQHKLRAAQLAGHDIGAVIGQITAAPLDGTRSISAVLHGRLQQLQLPDLGHGVTWAQRTPKDAPAVAHELAAGLDQRARALGEQLAVSPEPWLARRLGVLAPHASPLLREDYARRAAGVSELFGRHRALVSRMREAARGYRDEAKDVLGQYASNVANRQGQAINVLTVVATLFLPLTFLSGFFGMNFGVIVNDLNATWVFVVLGLLLPAASVAITLLLWRRLLRRFEVGKLAEPGSHADGGGDSGQTLTAPTLPAPPAASPNLGETPTPGPRAKARPSA